MWRKMRDNIQLNPNQYIIKIKGIQVSEGEILFDHYMAMNPGYVEEEITGIPTFEPSFHLPAIWITEGQRERAESLGYTVVDPPSIIATHLTVLGARVLKRKDAPPVYNANAGLRQSSYPLTWTDDIAICNLAEKLASSDEERPFDSHSHPDIEEYKFILSGSGSVTIGVGDETCE